MVDRINQYRNENYNENHYGNRRHYDDIRSHNEFFGNAFLFIDSPDMNSYCRVPAEELILETLEWKDEINETHIGTATIIDKKMLLVPDILIDKPIVIFLSNSSVIQSAQRGAWQLIYGVIQSIQTSYENVRKNSGEPHEMYSDVRFVRYVIEFVSLSHQLKKSKRRRIYANTSHQSIIKEVISINFGEQFSIEDSPLAKDTDYLALRNQVTQYDESDFEFIKRILFFHNYFFYFSYVPDTIDIKNKDDFLKYCQNQLALDNPFNSKLFIFSSYKSFQNLRYWIDKNEKTQPQETTCSFNIVVPKVIDEEHRPPEPDDIIIEGFIEKTKLHDCGYFNYDRSVNQTDTSAPFPERTFYTNYDMTSVDKSETSSSINTIAMEYYADIPPEEGNGIPIATSKQNFLKKSQNAEVKKKSKIKSYFFRFVGPFTQFKASTSLKEMTMAKNSCDEKKVDVDEGSFCVNQQKIRIQKIFFDKTTSPLYENYKYGEYLFLNGVSTTANVSTDNLNIFANKIAKPKVNGLELAVVVGDSSANKVGTRAENSYFIKPNLLNIQFAWENYLENFNSNQEALRGKEKPKKNEVSTTIYAPLVQPFSGRSGSDKVEGTENINSESHFSFWGIPRVGQEVVVSFVNGDPDRPIVLGSLYNGLSQVPFEDLQSPTSPPHETVGIRTWSVPQDPEALIKGHELSFTDSKDTRGVTLKSSDKVTVEAQGSRSEKINSSALAEEGNVKDEYQLVAGNRKQTITKGDDIYTNVTGDVTFTVTAGNYTLTLSKGEVKVTAADITLTATKTMKLVATTSIELDAPTIKIEGSASVEVNSPMLNLKSQSLLNIESMGAVLMKGTSAVNINSGGVAKLMGGATTNIAGNVSITPA